MRKIIVSNRLPFSAQTDSDGKIIFKESAGGLVSGLSAYLDSIYKTTSPVGDSVKADGYLWLGWPGAGIDKNLEKIVRQEASERFSARPVFIGEDIMDKFYHGFCNKTIWPLFHYFPSYVRYQEDYWQSYKEVNEKFAEAVLEEAKEDDFIWIHDYHLMLLPKYIREKFQKTSGAISAPTIGFFLHIPFPSFEIFRILPAKCRNEILEGLLGADVVGFHTQEYTQYFLRCVMRLLGYEHNVGVISLPERSVKADTFPMGIDYEKYHNAPSVPSVESEKQELEKNLSGQKVILSIERLDYTKGIVNRLMAYEIFLKNNPQWREKATLLMTIVPSRIGVEDYQEMKKHIDELVGRINGAYGKVGWTPVVYQYRYLPFAALSALYSLADVCLVTPLRDGMNLVAKEYVASGGRDGKGVLVLSEMAGASKELGEAVAVNPYDIEEMSCAILAALEMNEEERISRNALMRKRIARYDVRRWAEDFVTTTVSFVTAQKEKFNTRYLAPSLWADAVKSFQEASSRAVFLDYDGTIVPFAPYPWGAYPDEELLTLLKKISSADNTDVFIVSGRDRNTLEKWFGGLGLGLVGEHGVWIKRNASGDNKSEWSLSKPMTSAWKTGIMPLLEKYSDRLPGSFIEEKDYSISFHYRRADAELGAVRAKELMDDLIHLTANVEIQIFQGNKVIEIRNVGVNKGTAVMTLIQEKLGGYDFVAAIGDDWTDEDMFKALDGASSAGFYRRAITIRVGSSENSTASSYNLRDYRTARSFLKALAGSRINF